MKHKQEKQHKLARDKARKGKEKVKYFNWYGMECRYQVEKG